MENGRAIDLLVRQLIESRQKYKYKLLGYAIMPEHIHLVILPPEIMKLGLVIREIKSKMAREYFSEVRNNQSGKNVFWQKRCYDHNCRNTESVKEKITYCHNNPVKRGLVSEPGEYKWSSYNWYMGRRDVPILIDEYEM
jgi:putative transposase